MRLSASSASYLAFGDLLTLRIATLMLHWHYPLLIADYLGQGCVGSARELHRDQCVYSCVALRMGVQMARMEKPRLLDITRLSILRI